MSMITPQLARWAASNGYQLTETTRQPGDRPWPCTRNGWGFRRTGPDQWEATIYQPTHNRALTITGITLPNGPALPDRIADTIHYPLTHFT